ncbi:MAG: pyruvoyl-dependent arginine decarboxylase [Actinobacteria bacterium]|nr:pyruvoyl-dependent arginine decarboxylase [Actinomycetota bacterium]
MDAGVGTIRLTRARAEGETRLAAFDAALRRAGIADHNLIYLSSIIPAGTRVVRSRPRFDVSHFGNRLYCVMAERRTDKPGQQVWAGIGWVQERDSGRGLFAEADGETEADVRWQLEATLTEMAAARSEGRWGPISLVVQGSTCEDRPVCALVAGVYRSVPWTDPS